MLNKIQRCSGASQNEYIDKNGFGVFEWQLFVVLLVKRMKA